MSNQPGAAKPGFYPAENGRMRFWDGNRWTDRYADLEPAPPPPPQGATVAEPRKRSWFGRHKILTGLGLVILLGIVISMANGGKSSAPAASPSAASSASSPSATSTAPAAAATSTPSATSPAPAPAAPAAPAETVSQQNAVKKAKDYLSMTAFSRSGLIKQLVDGEGFSDADATFGVDKQNADWNEQAAKKAKEYLSMTSFSRSGLIKQLVDGEGFTNEQAQYGVQKTGL